MGQFEKWLQDNLIIVAGIFVGIALLQVSLSVYTTLLQTFVTEIGCLRKINNMVEL